MNAKLLSILMVVVLLTLVGCGKGAEMARSEKQRVTAPDVVPYDLADLVSGNSVNAREFLNTLILVHTWINIACLLHNKIFKG